jgi:uncharacterized membrane protein YcaP (DUF421 family)
MWEVVHEWIGPDRDAFQLRTGQMVIRAAFVFVLAIALARLGSTRFMARNSAFDLILAIMLGSVLSRAITGQSPFFPTLAAAAGLVGMHAAFAWLASRWDWFGYLVKGRARLLAENGKVIPGALKRHNVGEHDFEEALRIHGSSTSVEEVKAAYLERNGDISILLKEPR